MLAVLEGKGIKAAVYLSIARIFFVNNQGLQLPCCSLFNKMLAVSDSAIRHWK